jgi:DhnA family fructose-bisphosphate aldolase class Ia
MNPLRARRLFAADQRTVIVALDHASFMGPLSGLEDPGQLIAEVVAAGADAILTSYGVARAFGNCFGRAGLILRADGGASGRNPKPGALRQVFSGAEALRLGADAVVCMGMIGFAEEASSLQVLTDLVNDCAPLELPVLAEMLVKREDGGVPTPADLGYAMRIGVELGADWIKTSYAAPASDYRQALQTCYRPVVVLGGSKTDDDRLLLESIAAAMQAGAAGVAIGRNIWQHPNPTGITRGLVALVHGGADLSAALAEITA